MISSGKSGKGFITFVRSGSLNIQEWSWLSKKPIILLHSFIFLILAEKTTTQLNIHSLFYIWVFSVSPVWGSSTGHRWLCLGAVCRVVWQSDFHIPEKCIPAVCLSLSDTSSWNCRASGPLGRRRAERKRSERLTESRLSCHSSTHSWMCRWGHKAQK